MILIKYNTEYVFATKFHYIEYIRQQKYITKNCNIEQLAEIYNIHTFIGMFDVT